MRRTYRSKKETGGGLDPRDALAIDEKASVFDAFYIKNIKQAKREMSIGLGASTFATSNKVRKKKYVKRLKEQCPISNGPTTRESTSKYVYLTPDKSIHLKKAFDPFDLLLNSSTYNKAPLQTEHNVFSPLLPKTGKKKSYRKKAPNKKMLLYKNDTDSDKENSSDKSNIIQDQSSILSYQLEIEKEENLTPTNIDQSINNIVKDLSLLENIKKHTNSKSPVLFTAKDKLRLAVRSPLCSTPFIEKYRGKSIYKFSPISVQFDDSKHCSKAETLNESSIEENNKNYNTSHYTGTEQLEEIRLENKNNENSVQIESDQKHINCNNKFDSPILSCRSTTKIIVEEINSRNYMETSSFQTSGEEPFCGFSNSTSNSQNINLKDIIIKEYNTPINEKTLENLKHGKSHLNSFAENINNEYCHSDTNNSSHSNTTEDEKVVEESFNNLQKLVSKINDKNKSLQEIDLVNTTAQNIDQDTQQSIVNYIYSKENSISDDINDDHSLNEIDSTEAGETCSDESHSLGDKKSSDDEVCSHTSQLHSDPNSIAKSVKRSSESSQITLNTSENSYENDQSFDRNNSFDDSDSFYESCKSESEMSDINIDNKIPLVVIERLNESVFNRYYKKDANSSSVVLSQSDESSQESFSSEISNGKYDNIYYNNKKIELLIDENYSKENTIISISDTDPDDNENNKSDEDKFDSFVTRRRRNEKTKDSFILSFENSHDSMSSGDYDKTVLSNKHSFDSLKERNDITILNDVQINEDIAGEVCNDKFVPEENTEHIIDSDIGPSQKIRGISAYEMSAMSRMGFIQDETTKIPTNIDGNNEINHLTSRNSVRNGKSDKLSQNTLVSTESISEERSTIDNRLSINTTNINRVCTSEHDLSSRTISVPDLSKISKESSRVHRDNEPAFTQNVSLLRCETRKYSKINDVSSSELKQGIVLEPGKRWERSLSIYKRVTTMGDFNQSILDEELNNKGRKYRQSIINTLEMQDNIPVSIHNESVKSRRSTLYSKPSRSTIRILRESNNSRYSLSSSSTSEDLGFLTEDCDDTLVELSKLSIIDSEHEVTVLDKFNDTSNRITTARDYVLRRCNQTDVILFDECYSLTALKNCRKIGEGVYGEVFLWRAADGRARVLKVVPIAGDTKVNGENQKDYHEIISEIVIAMELSALRSPILDIEKHLDEGNGVETLDLHCVDNATDIFNEVLAVRCVYGSYPSRLLDLWELYDECKGSENENPAILPVDQQFMVLELANAGQDLESYQFHNAEQAYALFKQVAFGIAVAEESFQFEHRDLHWGNVLISPTDQKYATFVLRGRTHRVSRRGVAATIIDYSLSRLSLQLPSADCAALYNDLAADDGLFDAVGDYQFQVYRLMRDKLGNDWKNFEPYTNILWLHYTVDKMITALRYTRTNTKVHRHYIAKLKEIKNRILDYGSAVQYVLTDNEL